MRLRLALSPQPKATHADKIFEAKLLDVVQGRMQAHHQRSRGSVARFPLGQAFALFSVVE